MAWPPTQNNAFKPSSIDWNLLITSMQTWPAAVNANTNNLSNLGQLTGAAGTLAIASSILSVTRALGATPSANPDTNILLSLINSNKAGDARIFNITTDANNAAVLRGVGANIVMIGGNVGIAPAGGAFIPAIPLDVNGAIGTRKFIINLANGANENINVGTSTYCVITGPTGAFQIGGFTGGNNGRLLILVNGTGQTLTLNNLDAGSSAANQIFTLGKGNVSPSITSVYIHDGSTWNLLVNF